MFCDNELLLVAIAFSYFCYTLFFSLHGWDKSVKFSAQIPPIFSYRPICSFHAKPAIELIYFLVVY